MTAPIIKALTQAEHYQGPGAIAGIRFRSMGRALGVTAFGMNVLEIEAGCNGYPAHDHIKDGQEEVYVILKGSARFITPLTEQYLTEGMFVRVPPEVTRKFVAGDHGLTLLAIGSTPGQAYPTRS